MSIVFCRSCGKEILETVPTCPQCGELQGVNIKNNESVAVPDGVKGWSWGAFFLSWIWAIGNRTWVGLLAIPYAGIIMAIVLGIKGWSWGASFLNWIWAIRDLTWVGLLVLVPYAGIIMAIVLGIKGREWAWRNKKWNSVEHFNRVQKKWSYWGVLLFVVLFVIGILAGIAIPQYQAYAIKGHKGADDKIHSSWGGTKENPAPDPKPKENPKLPESADDKIHSSWGGTEENPDHPKLKEDPELLGIDAYMTTVTELAEKLSRQGNDVTANYLRWQYSPKEKLKAVESMKQMDATYLLLEVELEKIEASEKYKNWLKLSKEGPKELLIKAYIRSVRRALLVRENAHRQMQNPDTGQLLGWSDITIKWFGLSDLPDNNAEQNVQDSGSAHSFIKLDASGRELDVNATFWVMVRDNNTSLIWEVKENKDHEADYANPHDADNTYSWCDTNPKTNGGGQGICGDGNDTMDFLSSLNTARFGGFTDWRLPTITELKSLIDMSREDPTIDTAFFPDTIKGYGSTYWSSTPSRDNERDSKYNAWSVLFYQGFARPSRGKGEHSYVRAVHGGQ